MLDQCKTAGASNTRFVWVTEKFLMDHQADPSKDLPLWIPKSATDYSGFFTIDCGRALKSGLTIRPLAETARDVLAFARHSLAGSAEPVMTGLSPDREATLLEAWKALSHV